MACNWALVGTMLENQLGFTEMILISEPLS